MTESRAEAIVRQLEEMSEDGRCSSSFNFGLIRRVEERLETLENKTQRMFDGLLKAQHQLGEVLAEVGQLTRRVERIANHLNRQKGGDKQ